MSRLDEFNIKFEELHKHNVKIDYSTGLELPTEYKKLCQIRDGKNQGKIHCCKDCENLKFSFDQNTYVINYFCQKNGKKEISIEDVDKLIVCAEFEKIKIQNN